METWRRNLYILWIGNFMAGVANSMIIPFIPLFIGELGVFTNKELTFWSGIVFSAAFLMTALVSPLWGKLADMKGRKLMLLRSALGMSVMTLAMGFVANVYQLVALRVLFGLMSGFHSNSIALMATSAPREKAGEVLGTLSTGTVTGTLLGPVIGGVIAQYYGYRMAFHCTGAIMFLVFLLVWQQVKEDFTPPVKTIAVRQKHPGIFSQLQDSKIVLAMFLTTLMIQINNNSINPILSLYVKELLNHTGNISLASGIIAAMPGVATLIAAPQFGKLGDRFGTHKVLMGGLILSILIYMPMAFVTSVWQLGALRLFVGISDAALLPSVNAILMKNSPKNITSRIFSYNQSVQSTGNVVGPMVGSTVSGHFGFSAVFFVTSFLAFVNFLGVRRTTKGMSVGKTKI